MSISAESPPQSTSTQPHSWIRWAVLFLCALLWFGYRQSTTVQPISEIGQQQRLASIPAPIVGDDTTLEQIIHPERNYFHEIELTVAKHNTVIDPEGEITLCLWDEQDELIATETWKSGTMKNNQSLVFHFPEQADSASQSYRLQILGVNNTAVSFWGTSVDAYDEGAFSVNGESAEIQDLRFLTRYAFSWNMGVETTIETVQEQWPLFVVATLFLLLPSALWRQNEQDPFALLGVQFGTGIALWSLIWLWTTVVDFRWNPLWLWMALFLGWCGVLLRVLLYVRKPRPNMFAFHWHHLLLIGVLALTAILRIVAVRELVYPSWVDSGRHGLITAVMSESGQFLQNYAPFYDIDQSHYHFGFHTISASLHLLLNTSLPTNLLWIGQFFQLLVGLSVYTAIWKITQRRGTAILGAFLVGVLFIFPSYYMNWGRLTQLTGMILLPLVIAEAWGIAQRKKGIRPLVRLAVLCSGLFLVHLRVFLLIIPFFLLLWIGYRFRGTIRYLFVTVVTTYFILPRLFDLGRGVSVDLLKESHVTYHKFPIHYLELGVEKTLWIATASVVFMALLVYSFHFLKRFNKIIEIYVFLHLISLTIWLCTGFALVYFTDLSLTTPLQRIELLLAFFLIYFLLLSVIQYVDQDRKWSRLILVLSAWVGILFLLLGDSLNIPKSWVMNLNSMIITLFFPFALILSFGASAVWDALRNAHPVIVFPLFVLMGIGIGEMTTVGIREQIDILNSRTAMVTQADVDAIAWMDDHLPEDAIIGVSSWKWLNSTYSAEDGGMWIPILLQRQTTTPPADYMYNLELAEQVTEYNLLAKEIQDWGGDAAEEFLRSQNVTHLYMGPKAKQLKPEQLLKSDAYQLEYSKNGAFVFSITE